jgi:hypothetical protein
MAARARRSSTLTAALVLAAVLAPAVGANSRENPAPVFPTLYVQYALNCTFTIVDDAGNTVTSIAPGRYDVAVTTPIMFSLVNTQNLSPGNFNGCRGYVQFQLTGPSVSLYTTLFNGCESFQVLASAQFRPSSTYVAQDNNQPGVARVVFTTLATGTPPVPTSPLGVATGKGTVSKDLVGSDVIRGTLSGALSANGKSTLTSKGKSVSILKAGRYRFAIDDRDAKRSFTIQAPGGKPDDLTTASFVGKHSVFITLTAGRWMFYSGLGKPSSFLVIG